MISSLSFLFAIALAIAGFAEFLMNDGDKLWLGDRLNAWWLRIENGDWGTLSISTTNAVLRFLDTLFGSRLFSVRSLVVSAALATSYTWIAFEGGFTGFRDILSIDFWRGMATTGIIPGNWAGEFVAVSLLRGGLRWIARSQRTSWLLPVLICLLVAHIGSATSFCVMAVVYPNGLSLPAQSPVATVLELLGTGLIGPEIWITDRSGLDIERDFFLPPIITSMSALMLFLSVWFVALTRPVSKPILSRIVQRLATAPKGAIATTAALLSLVASVLDKFPK
jgi:hypothetical protein